jgi:hypothetical protein
MPTETAVLLIALAAAVGVIAGALWMLWFLGGPR